jgi:uncharacterized protein
MITIISPILSLARRLAVAMAATVIACTAAPAAAQSPSGMGTPGLWVVRDEDTTIYLFGTVHALPAGLQWYHPRIDAALAESEELVTEVPPDERIDLMHVVRTYGYAQDAVPMSRRLTREQHARYSAAMRRNGLPIDFFERAAPWMPAVFLQQGGGRADNWQRALGVETRLWRAARGHRLRTSGLENAYFQLSFYGIMSLPTQTQMLDEAVSVSNADLPQRRAYMAELLRSWHSGNATRLGEMINAAEAENPEYHDIILRQRNARWAEWIRMRLDEPGGRFFVAVGAAHVSGTDSVQAQLAALGLTATRVEY